MYLLRKISVKIGFAQSCQYTAVKIIISLLEIYAALASLEAILIIDVPKFQKPWHSFGTLIHGKRSSIIIVRQNSKAKDFDIGT